jgi:hypothetical protein
MFMIFYFEETKFHLKTSYSREFEQDFEDEDELDNFCPSAHYHVHTEFGVTGGCSTCLPAIYSFLAVYEY